MTFESLDNSNKDPKINSRGQFEIDFSEMENVSKKYNIHVSLLSLHGSEWFACGMPIEEYVKERDLQVEELKSKGHNSEELIKLMSKKDGIWYMLYHGHEFTIPEWEKQIELDKLYDNSDRTAKQKHSDYLYGRD